MTQDAPTQLDDGFDALAAENKRRDILCRATCSGSTILLLIYAIKDIATGEASTALVISLYAILNLSAMGLYERFRKINLFSYYLVFAVASLVIFLLCSGGSGNSGIMWLPTFPILMFSILPVAKAAYVTVVIYAIAAFVLFGPSPFFITSEYSSHIKYAGLGATLLIGLFTYAQARAREYSMHSIATLNKELRQIASTDALTHLANRRDMSLRLEFECKRATRSKNEFSIILCDIDHFKKVNDSFGHSVGDQALKAFSRILESRFRETDKVGRWGGEEFLVILPHTSVKEAIEVANKVRTEVCKASLLENTPSRVITMSAGVASSVESTDPGTLLKLADNQLYKAKNNGRNQIMPVS